MPFDASPLPRRAQILLGALEILRSEGWCQGTARSDDGRYCMYAAIREAGGLRSIGEFNAMKITYPASFNDAPGRTFEEVEKWFLRRIAKSLR